MTASDRELDPDRWPIHRTSRRGFEQAYVREGVGGTPLLLVHGWPETKRIWWRNIGPLAEAGFEVIVPDLRGFGDSGLAPDGFGDAASHSMDLYSLVHDELGHEHVMVVGGDLGGVVMQDLALRYPGFVTRIVVFNSPLPYFKDEMAGMRTRGARESSDYYVRQGNDADALAAELATPGQRNRYIATFYTSRFWAHPGTFTPEAVDFMASAFEDGAKLRASFTAYESAYRDDARVEPAKRGRIDIPTLILFGPSDHVLYPEFDRMAAVVFPDHVGPFLVRDAGHFLQWEAADVLNGAIRMFCRAD